MRRLHFVITILLLNLVPLYGAIFPAVAQGDTIQKQVEWVKQIMVGGEWQATNKEQAASIYQVLQFVENRPIDSLVNSLEQSDLSGLLRRDIQFIEHPERVSGYISGEEVHQEFYKIEQQVESDIDDESILVPEDQFVGMYAKIPIVTKANIDQLFRDSLITIPNNLQHVTIEQTRFRQKEDTINPYIDSLRAVYIDSVRMAYNDQLIRMYRDSVTRSYRMAYKATVADSLKKKYSDFVAQKNITVLNYYNDSVALVLNNKMEQVVNSLISYSDRVPNRIMVSSLYNDTMVLPLRNNNAWFKWVWLKNSAGDSIGIRVDNLGRNSFRVLVDESVNISRVTERNGLDIYDIQPEMILSDKLEKFKNRKPELSPWNLGGKAYGGMSQAVSNKYWAKGASNTAAYLTTFYYSADYSKKKIKWENNVDFKLGATRSLEEKDTTKTYYRDWKKNSNNLNLTSKLGVSAFKDWYYSTDFEIKTQIFNSYSSVNDSLPRASFFAPAYLNFSIGLDYKPNKNLSAFVSPVSLKTTFVPNRNVDETKYGLKEGETHKISIGATGKFNFAKSITDDIAIRTKNSMFINFGNNVDGENQFWKLPDLDSETTIDFKVNQFISTQLNLHFVYDKDLKSEIGSIDEVKDAEGNVITAAEKIYGTRLQFKEFFTFGITYNFR